ncbi:MAG: CheR family methyltransferase, partial [Myxococcaceae bacterium]
RWRVRDELRRLARFAPLNLKEAGYPALPGGTASLDVVFCRNVFIYFAPELAAVIAARLAGCLAPGGFLFFGPSDPVPPSLPGLEQVRCEATMVYRRSDGPPQELPKPHREHKRAAPPGRPPPPTLRPALGEAPKRPAPAEADGGQPTGTEEGARLWLSRHPDSALACYSLSMLLRERGDAAAALEYARRAVCLEPTLALGHFALGELFEAGRKDAEAGGCFAHALELVQATADDALLEGSDEITAGWLRRILAARLARGGREG